MLGLGKGCTCIHCTNLSYFPHHKKAEKNYKGIPLKWQKKLVTLTRSTKICETFSGESYKLLPKGIKDNKRRNIQFTYRRCNVIGMSVVSSHSHNRFNTTATKILPCVLEFIDELSLKYTCKSMNEQTAENHQDTPTEEQRHFRITPE